MYSIVIVEKRREGEPGEKRREGEPGEERREGEPGEERREGEPGEERRGTRREEKRREGEPGENRNQEDYTLYTRGFVLIPIPSMVIFLHTSRSYFSVSDTFVRRRVLYARLLTGFTSSFFFNCVSQVFGMGISDDIPCFSALLRIAYNQFVSIIVERLQ
jgi:hypothetical protein